MPSSPSSTLYSKYTLCTLHAYMIRTLHIIHQRSLNEIHNMTRKTLSTLPWEQVEAVAGAEEMGKVAQGGSGGTTSSSAPTTSRPSRGTRPCAATRAEAADSAEAGVAAAVAAGPHSHSLSKHYVAVSSLKLHLQPLNCVKVHVELKWGTIVRPCFAAGVGAAAAVAAMAGVGVGVLPTREIHMTPCTNSLRPEEHVPSFQPSAVSRSIPVIRITPGRMAAVAMG
jgi:hypothetical protein